MNTSNILFSSVKGGPSFVHSPHVPKPLKNNSASYILSILDPNLDLPELTTKDIEDFLSEANGFREIKTVKDTDIKRLPSSEDRPNNGTKKHSLIINSSTRPLYEESVKESINSEVRHLPTSCIMIKCLVKSCLMKFPSKSEQLNHFFADHKEKVIQCPSCQSPFTSKYSLNNHFLVSPSCKIKNSYRCSVKNCDKYFFSKVNLESHMSQQHHIPAISCLLDSCPVKFQDVSQRDIHVKAVHSEITYNCEHCSEGFVKHIVYDRHKLKSIQCFTKCSTCSVDGCDKSFSTVSNMRRHQQQVHGNAYLVDHIQSASDSGSVINSTNPLELTKPLKNNEIKVVYACPLPECLETLNDKAEFQSHFLKHFTGELPGDINSLLPPDPPVPGLELHSKTFEANVDSPYQREETNLLQALDLVPDKLLESLDFLDDDDSCEYSPNCGLTSALILSSTEGNNNRNFFKNQSVVSNRRRKNPYQNSSEKPCLDNSRDHNKRIESSDKSMNTDDDGFLDYASKPKHTKIAGSNSSFAVSSSSCSRTCPRINSSMVSLIKRRRVFLKERIEMMKSCDSVLYQPAGRQPAVKQVIHQIFSSQHLPNKYVINEDISTF